MRRSDRNWTIVQIFYRDPVPVSERHPAGWRHRVEKFVVENPYKREAEKIVSAWLIRQVATTEGRKRYGCPHEIHYYPRNYVQMRDHLVAAGRIIQ